ncbi:MAG: hypothetical protein LC793_14535 [Thermomicrobia bacterium]|nr:hypothetical protein [Thermomicrobia bacterium]MCA1722784.1 hypothetical protein [Thermomicrobia bacterium]
MTPFVAKVGTTPAVPTSGAAGFVFAARRGAERRAEKKGVANGATEDTDNAHDDTERSDPMKKTAPDTATMLGIVETMTLVEQGLTEMRTLLFHRKKQREKQRR